MKNKFKILDCTMRDGGYYTNWDFDSVTVENYIKHTNNLPLDYIEIGYKNPKNIREAEVVLKEFDISTNYKYNFSSYFKYYIGYRLNRFYSDVYRKKMISQNIWHRALRRIKRLIFKSFYESLNNHN